MSHRHASRLVAGAAGLLGVCAAVLFATGQTRWGGAGLALALVAVAVGNYLATRLTGAVLETLSGQNRRGRQVVKRLDGIAEEVRALESSVASRLKVLESTTTQTQEVVKQLSSHLAEQGKSTRMLREGMEQVDRVSRQTRSGVRMIQTELTQLPYYGAELQRLYGRLVQDDHAMPPLGGWALTTPTLLELVHEVLHDNRRKSIVECGSGTSTVWMALALEARGGDGFVTALEHDARFGEQTRRQLREHGVSHRARVVDTGLATVTVDGHEERPWYDLRAAELPEAIDVLFVDGPVGSLADFVRYPAYPLLADRLAEDALVVLDDTNRGEEREIVDRWTAAPVAGRRLEEVRSTDRATVMKVC